MLRIVVGVFAFPVTFLLELFWPDDFDAFEAAHRQHLIDMAEGE